MMNQVATVLSQQAEGASFLWEVRSQAVAAPHYSLADLAKLDLRVEANLDGLRVAGEPAWDLCKEALSTGESGEAFVAGVLAFESGAADRIQTALSAAPKFSSALASALGWIPFPQAEPHIQHLLASPLRRIGVAASAIHRHNPGTPLPDAIAATDPLLRSRALRAVGELGLDRLFPELYTHLADPDNGCRFSAAWSATLLADDAKSLATLRAIAESNLPDRERALQLAVRRMEAPAAIAWRDKLAPRLAIVAAGAFGDPESIPWLLDQMKVPELARVAGEAFSMITGVDIAFDDLDGDQPKGFEAGPTENPEDEDVAMDPDEHLPWPDPTLIAKCWSRRRSEFQGGERHLLGKPITVESCQEILRTGRQRQRAAAALELAIRQPGQPLFHVAAPGFRQQQLLGLRRR
jgi:uncharacterized protein (TIGR02270 family)